MHSSLNRFSNMYISDSLQLLGASASASTARVRCARLRVSDAPSCLILTDICRKVVVICAELASAIRAHPAAARSSANLKRHTAIRA